LNRSKFSSNLSLELLTKTLHNLGELLRVGRRPEPPATLKWEASKQIKNPRSALVNANSSFELLL